MHYQTTFILICGLMLPVIACGDGHWSYSGETGPENWGELSEEYSACSDGSVQSPIDITPPFAGDAVDLEINYKPSHATIKNNGHTIQIDVQNGGTISVDGKDYRLLQFHFHSPSEEAVVGQRFNMVTHLVHTTADNELAVIAVLLEGGSDAHDAFAPIFSAFPQNAGEVAPLEGPVDASQLLPDVISYWSYQGSLTTPPCSEGVQWMVMQNPVTISDSQLQAFTALYEMNARPLQPVNGRPLGSFP